MIMLEGKCVHSVGSVVDQVVLSEVRGPNVMLVLTCRHLFGQSTRLFLSI